MAEPPDDRIEVSAGDLDDLDALHYELRGVPGISVSVIAAPRGLGEQGTAVDFLTVACSGGAITVFLQILKVLASARGPRFSLKIRLGKNSLELTARNVNEVLPLVQKFFDES
jgi:hypothetical protein